MKKKTQPLSETAAYKLGEKLSKVMVQRVNKEHAEHVRDDGHIHIWRFPDGSELGVFIGSRRESFLQSVQRGAKR